MNIHTYFYILILILILILLYCTFKTENIVEEMNVASENMKTNVYDKYGIQINKNSKELIYDGKKVNYDNNFNELAGIHLSKNKVKTNELLKHYGFPVCNYVTWDNNKDTETNINNINNQLNFPLVVKYSLGERGNDVFTDVIDNASLLNKINHLIKQNKTEIIIEEQTVGKKFRIMILNGKFVYAEEHDKPVIKGNGKYTIQQLIHYYPKKNNVKPILVINEELINQQGYQLNDILEKDKQIYVTNVVSVLNGCTHQYIDERDINPINLNLFYRLNNVVGLNLSGIDYIGPDLDIPYYLGNGKIIEVNSFPGFSKKEQQDTNIPGRLIHALFT